MIEIRTYQSDRSVACHAVGVVRQVKLDWSTGLPDREDMTSSETWLEAYGRRHAGTYPVAVHLDAVRRFAKSYDLGEVQQAPVDTTARGYVFRTNKERIEQMASISRRDEDFVAVPEGSIVDNKEISQELVNGWIDSYRTRGKDEEGKKERMDWAGIVEAVRDNHGIQLPNDNRHPVSTKIQRLFREIVKNGMEPAPTKRVGRQKAEEE